MRKFLKFLPVVLDIKEKFNMLNRYSLAVVLLLLPGISSATNFECTGPVSGVTVTPQGGVIVDILQNWRWQTICNLESTSNGVSPGTCKAIYSLLLTAQTTKRNVRLWFSSGDCSAASQTSWTALANWYFGPSLVD
jgi:hypothetical protein